MFDLFEKLVYGFFVLGILLCLGLMVGGIIMNLGNQQIITATVFDTFIDDGNTFFVLQDSNGNKFACENEDSLWYGKFTSNDFLIDIETGKTYEFFLVGYRVPFFSQFPNIIRYSEVY
jgi:hypothetical protein